MSASFGEASHSELKVTYHLINRHREAAKAQVQPAIALLFVAVLWFAPFALLCFSLRYWSCCIAYALQPRVSWIHWHTRVRCTDPIWLPQQALHRWLLYGRG